MPDTHCGSGHPRVHAVFVRLSKSAAFGGRNLLARKAGLLLLRRALAHCVHIVLGVLVYAATHSRPCRERRFCAARQVLYLNY
mmetsp:Transcript_4193/g.13450  ORF Transcript_4193/g.13450 Transcript_4193/m.13450 type:complete len:83 (-) Transcript_4193:20-268(-)